MPEILTLLSCLTFDLNDTSLKHLSCIIQAMLAMSGRVTMLGISRWGGKGGSYRTIQRFFYSPKNWPTLMWVFFRTHCFCPQEKYALAGDEVVTTKSGHKTYGVDWFFSREGESPRERIGLLCSIFGGAGTKTILSLADRTGNSTCTRS